MRVEQIYTKCLAQGSYYIESNGEAVVIDPLRDVDGYINLAKENNSKIKYVLETHFHADFISGHLTLANLTGADIIYGPNADPEYDAIIAEDNQVFNFGNASLTTIHTPGHTSNHLCYSLEEENILFTGDHVMGWATTVIVPPDGDMDDYISSLKKLLVNNYELYFPTHGNVIKNPKKYVRGLIAHRKMREIQILDELKKNNLSINEMVPKFYSTTDKRLWPAASMSLLATLVSLEKKKIIISKKNHLRDNEKVWVYNIHTN